MHRALIMLAAAAALTACAGDAAHEDDRRAPSGVVEVAEVHDAPVALLPVSKAEAALAAARFQRLAELEGDWVMPEGDGTTQLVYEVTANGSAVVETVFPGQSHEMVSVYTVDSGRLVMTHYCAMGNQPYMVAASGGTADVIRFECQKAGNTQSHADAHMHLGVFTIGDGTLKTEWTRYADLEAGQTVGFELVRGGM